MPTFTNSLIGQSADAIIAALQRVMIDDENPAAGIISRLKQMVPFRQIAISGLDVDGHGVGTATFLLSDLPPDFLAEYLTGDYGRSDPLCDKIREGGLIGRDSDALATPEARRDASEVLDLLRRHGIPERTVIMLKSGDRIVGAITAISDARLDDQDLETLRVIGSALHLEVARPIVERLNEEINLAKGEQYCLSKAAYGLTSDQIAKDGLYSVETVNTYLKSAMKKLGAQNRTQAVAEAIRRRIIA